MNQRIDPITLEVIKQELVSIPNQIDKHITRTAFSPLIAQYKEYSGGIVVAEGLLAAKADSKVDLKGDIR